LHLTEDADDSLLALDSVREAAPIGEDELASPFILSTGQFLSCLQAADADAYFDEVQDAAAANTGNEIDKLLPTTVSMGLTVK
jgi:hypothetical protein